MGMKMYWDLTGDWRLTYYSALAKRDLNTLSPIEKAELELDSLERDTTELLLRSKKEGSLLDIGCGVGRQILEFSEKWPNFRFLGIDISSYQINLMNSVIRSNLISNVTGVVMDAAYAGNIEEHFDIITFFNNSFGCLDFDQQINCLNSINGLLTSGGILLISCFERMDLVEKAYNEWGLPPKDINYSTGIVDLGEYQSGWKSSEVFLPYFERHATISFEKCIQGGLGTVYIFKKLNGGDANETI